MNAMPIVSCIMPTRNRRSFISQAIKYFKRQDYKNKELIIVDDGEDKVVDLIPEDEQIRYCQLDTQKSIGAKRNFACERATGDLIAHFDDDDWMAPNRLTVQVAELLKAKADLCGARELLYYHLVRGEAWEFCHPAKSTPWLASSTLLYRRSAWEGHFFDEDRVNESTEFVRHFNPYRIHALCDNSIYTSIIHRANTHPKNPSGQNWRRLPFDRLNHMLALDRDFYIALRNNRSLPQYGSLKLSLPTVHVAAPFMVYDGYGSVAEYLVLGMARAGANINVFPLSLELTGLTNEFQEILRRSQSADDGPVLYFCWPNSDLYRFLDKKNLFINTMWESSRLPADWPDRLNRARAVIVPTRFVAEVCRSSGVKVPIEVVPQGVDPNIYCHVERPERSGLTTLIVGTVIGRKHVNEGIAAWKLAFANDSGARLIIKARFGYKNFVPDDTRIHIVDTNETTRGILHWYRDADVLLALGNEGFGLPLIEGMATGLPVIALNSEGQSDVCEEVGRYLLPVEPSKWEPCNEAPFGPAGTRAVPGVEDVAARLRWVATHRDEACDMGRAASEWVLKNRNIWRMGPAVLEVMENYVRPAQALRRAYTFWVPSWNSQCGVAEYTAHLTQKIPNVLVSGPPPDVRGLKLLHIQHEHALFEDIELLEFIRRSHKSNVPVVITEHSVLDRSAEWEREADVLVALKQRGTEILKRRWPAKRVEHIPHGCPTWFPPRKRSSGSVIGTFGFLEHYKGFWTLLEVLRKLGGTELLMFSYAKSAEIEEEWNQASIGLPVQRISAFLPIQEIACRLAAEADILVFWYDEIPYYSASGAVRVGLATGVPVLVSPTGWFRELREATFQPSNLVEGVKQLLEDKRLQNQLSESAREYCHRNSWSNVAKRHVTLWQSL